ncbi:hypothetical protein VZT92_006190 [Zoarces viviparus]|uniref:Uncharacterized protein n=1 Tax=Zoarces viviparus TaxID=48416 RepID=A0AAW1FNQ4_ZOAVI
MAEGREKAALSKEEEWCFPVRAQGRAGRFGEHLSPRVSPLLTHALCPRSPSSRPDEWHTAVLSVHEELYSAHHAEGRLRL